MKSLDDVMRAAFIDNPSGDREEIRADCLKRFGLKPNVIEAELFSFWFNKEYPGFVIDSGCQSL